MHCKFSKGALYYLKYYYPIAYREIISMLLKKQDYKKEEITNFNRCYDNLIIRLFEIIIPESTDIPDEIKEYWTKAEICSHFIISADRTGLGCSQSNSKPWIVHNPEHIPLTALFSI